MENDFKKQSIDFAMRFMGLPLNQTFTSEELKARYHDLAKKYHPDRAEVSPMASQENFEQLQSCYELLSSNIEEINQIIEPKVNSEKRRDHFEPFFDFEDTTREPYVKKATESKTQQKSKTVQQANRKVKTPQDSQKINRNMLEENKTKVIVLGVLFSLLLITGIILEVFIGNSILLGISVFLMFGYVIWILAMLYQKIRRPKTGGNKRHRGPFSKSPDAPGKKHVPKEMYKPIAYVGGILALIFIAGAVLMATTKFYFLSFISFVLFFAYLIWIGSMNQKKK